MKNANMIFIQWVMKSYTDSTYETTAIIVEELLIKKKEHKEITTPEYTCIHPCKIACAQRHYFWYFWNEKYSLVTFLLISLQLW